MAMVAVVLTASNPRSDIVLLDSCDYVEINHVYNINEETGEFVLRMTQYIWWEWKDRVLLPVLNKGDRAAREIKCKWLTTTHTSYDVEIENRAILKQDERNHFQKR